MRKLSGTVFILTIFAVFSAACSNVATTRTAETSNNQVVADSPNTASRTNVSGERTFKVDFKSEPSTIQAGTAALLTFAIKDEQNAPVKDLQIVHEKPIHLLVVSVDLAEFYHLHPEPSADGLYRASHVFPNGGEYRLYADFTPKDAAQIVERIDVKVVGSERAKVALAADSTYEKTLDSLRVVMKPNAAIKAGAEITLDFRVFDAASGKPAADLQNYLGELAHFVIISEDLEDFVHAHPMSKGEKMINLKTAAENSENHPGEEHDHSTMNGAATKASASEVSAHTTFPRAGLYKLWAQFQRDGKVSSVPFVIEVPIGDTETAKAAEIPAGATKITVSAKGYEPSSIPAKKNQPVKLAFYRADADNCGGEVVFSKQNIIKKLPVGEVVLIEFTPTETGDIAFACGMEMFKGKLVVGD